MHYFVPKYKNKRATKSHSLILKITVLLKIETDVPIEEQRAFFIFFISFTPPVFSLIMVPVVGLEPTRQRHTILSRGRLPIPTHRHFISRYYIILKVHCQEKCSNFLKDKKLIFCVRTNLHTNPANRTSSDVLEMGFHIITALFRVEHIVSFRVNTPLVPFNCT